VSYAIAFLAGAALDVFYVTWISGIQKSNYLQPALASMAIGVAGLLGLGQALNSPLAAVCYVCGLGAGTVIGVWYGRR
jgi:hypothetical protein